MKRPLAVLLCVSPLLLLLNWWRISATGEGPLPPRNVTVLLWHWPFDVALPLQGDVCLELYGIPRCRLLRDRSALPAAHLVVFHSRELERGWQALPLGPQRPRSQRWVWMSLESSTGDLRRFGGVFNLTMSYRRDADITIPYGRLEPREPPGAPGGLVVVKSVPVCWVVSAYSPEHRRSRVYTGLRDMMPVAVYGHWNNNPLSARDLLPTISRCYFYLAFENSESKDYITEKLWRNAYGSGAVPVVLGPPPGDYEAVAPRGSYIHVDEFASVEDLGRRLQELMEDRESYAGYLEWQRAWRVKSFTDWRERLCSICSQYDRLPENKTYPDLHAWARA
ncbi:hypothetical protein NHX12_026825 [Muraenolepis orangiensis]|uniref:Fucosyltransferase n=1 Tax=Muraenolepis orangiensis TaxID=630683 RepID=A0A9Q0EFS8_9TELE|nr:hypothetical protein NHX12_026825 [Muraenolepis orangiensis]